MLDFKQLLRQVNNITTALCCNLVSLQIQKTLLEYCNNLTLSVTDRGELNTKI